MPARGTAAGARPMEPLRYLQQAAHLGAQSAELLRRRLGVELGSQQLLGDAGVAVEGGLGDAAQQRAQRPAALGRRRRLGRRHDGWGGAGLRRPRGATSAPIPLARTAHSHRAGAINLRFPNRSVTENTPLLLYFKQTSTGFALYSLLKDARLTIKHGAS